eukprot:1794244-Alexandrium_andersonii.AAC.1
MNESSKAFQGIALVWPHLPRGLGSRAEWLNARTSQALLKRNAESCYALLNCGRPIGLRDTRVLVPRSSCPAHAAEFRADGEI